ncbi:MAG TPA: hypothetical protein VN636_01455 [Acidimicrobiia bacterium]|nr:hypothetical protein [Acidimicrobiia bacterium]
MTTSELQGTGTGSGPTPAAGIPVPPYDGDDDEPVFRPRPRKRAHTLTFVLGGLVLAALGFLGGVAVQKHEDRGSTTSAAGTTAAARAFARGTGGTGASGSGGGGFAGRLGGATVGTVKLVDGKNIYVTDSNGNVVKVVTTDASQLQKTDAATVKDVVPGETVVVRGTQNSDGSVTASSLTATPAGASGGFGGFGGGGGSGAGG